MSETSGSFVFHGVGQGLCYSGQIFEEGMADVNFIYDCGTLYKKDRIFLDTAINKIFDIFKKKVTFLFLSHLDKDHIYGVPQLLKEFDVEYVFCPIFPQKS